MLGSASLSAISLASSGGSSDIRIELHDEDIAQAAIDPNHGYLSVKLSPLGTERLHGLTKRSLGRTAELRIFSMFAVRSRINAVVESGVVVIGEPSHELLEALSDYMVVVEGDQ